MKTVVQFCVDHDIVKSAPNVGFAADAPSGVQLAFSTKYIEEVAKQTQ